jgi:hypothetical protein
MADPLRPSRFLDPVARAELHARVDYRRRAVLGWVLRTLLRAAAWTMAGTIVLVVLVVLAGGTIKGAALVVAQVTWAAAALLAVRLLYRAGRRKPR